MARKTINPLLDLAWAALPEEVAVARVAHQVIEKGYEWCRGEKGLIRNLVRKSRPPRGQIKKRTEAVVLEMARLDEVLRTRGRNQPIDWSKWQPESVSRRRQHVFNRIRGKVERNSELTCHSLSKVDGSLICLVEVHYWNAENYVLIMRPRPAIGPRQQIRVMLGEVTCHSGSGEQHATRAIVRRFAPVQIQAALLNGRIVLLDWDRLETQIEQADGTIKSVPWETR